MLNVSEVFYSIQGEGATMGRPAVFLRLAACNLMCGGRGTEKDQKLHHGATWRCDTIEVWLKGTQTPYHQILNDDMVEHLRNGAHLIITGGEPLLQQVNIVAYLLWFESAYKFTPFIEIETNGTKEPNDVMAAVVDQWNVSPKLSNSGEPKPRRLKPWVLEKFKNLDSAIFKFVITSDADWQEVLAMLDSKFIHRHQVWLMPGASTIDQLLERNQMVARLALENELRFSTRLQVEIWNQTTGV